MGSSIGITVCKTKEKLKNAISLAFLFDREVLVENLVENLKEVSFLFVKDMGSTNGTFLNGRRIPADKYVKLNPGDKITVGSVNVAIS